MNVVLAILIGTVAVYIFCAALALLMVGDLLEALWSAAKITGLLVFVALVALLAVWGISAVLDA